MTALISSQKWNRLQHLETNRPTGYALPPSYALCSDFEGSGYA